MANLFSFLAEMVIISGARFLVIVAGNSTVKTYSSLMCEPPRMRSSGRVSGGGERREASSACEVGVGVVGLVVNEEVKVT